MEYEYRGRRFVIFRNHDVSGISGTGVIAEGIEFPSGKAVMHWVADGKPQSLGVYESTDELIQIHGHGGLTEIRWVD